MNSFSNNLTSTFKGSTPGVGSATQCRTPCKNCKPSQSSKWSQVSQLDLSYVQNVQIAESSSHSFKEIPVDCYLKFRSLQRVIFSSNFDNIIRTITIDNICAFYGECIPSNQRKKMSYYCKYRAGEIDRQVDSDKLSQKKRGYLSMTDLPGASP